MQTPQKTGRIPWLLLSRAPRLLDLSREDQHIIRQGTFDSILSAGAWPDKTGKRLYSLNVLHLFATLQRMGFCKSKGMVLREF